MWPLVEHCSAALAEDMKPERWSDWHATSCPRCGLWRVGLCKGVRTLSLSPSPRRPSLVFSIRTMGGFTSMAKQGCSTGVGAGTP